MKYDIFCIYNMCVYVFMHIRVITYTESDYHNDNEYDQKDDKKIS